MTAVQEAAPANTVAGERVNAWLAEFESALAARDVDRAAGLFATSSFWRDLVSFTWNLTTVEGREGVTDLLLAGAGITDLSRITLVGLEKNEHWNEVILQELGTLDEHRIRSEVVATAVEMTTNDPNIGALLLECSDLPPYSAAVSKATGLPVYDWAGFIRFVYDSVVPRTYGGIS